MKGGMMYEQKDIVLIPFPYTDLTAAKQRPALIISNMAINKGQDRICCLITSNASVEGIELTNKVFASGGLPFRSWIKPHRIFTIHEKIIKRKLCAITDDFHEKVITQLNNVIKRRS